MIETICQDGAFWVNVVRVARMVVNLDKSISSHLFQYLFVKTQVRSLSCLVPNWRTQEMMWPWLLSFDSRARVVRPLWWGSQYILPLNFAFWGTFSPTEVLETHLSSKPTKSIGAKQREYTPVKYACLSQKMPKFVFLVKVCNLERVQKLKPRWGVKMFKSYVKILKSNILACVWDGGWLTMALKSMLYCWYLDQQ